MEGYGPETYGDRIADVYDALYAGMNTEAAVEAIASLAGDGPLLELGIGTGRLALPLAERGLAVHGVDASEAMVAKLRGKPGGDRISVTMGDFADVPVDGTYTLIFIGFNTFFALLSQEDQLRCFANVADRLAAGGLFALEAFVPDLARYDRGQRVNVIRLDPSEVMLDAALHDPVGQRIEAEHVVITEQGIRLYPVNLRYAFPAELDLMARLAGLELKERWGGWSREPFTADSPRHVSVYGR
jgi:SAM-dependent methyltransferase